MKHPFKLLLCLLCALLLRLPTALAAAPNGEIDVDIYAQASKRYESARVPVVNLSLDGAPLLSDVPALIWQGRTMIPVRLVGEKLGAKVTWVDERDQVILRKGDTTITLTLGSAAALVNGKSVSLPDAVPATVMRLGGAERTMVPLRFVSEQLGCTVNWHQDSYTASLLSPGRKPGMVTAIHADANAQTVLISTDVKPDYRLQDFGDRVVLDFPGLRLAEGFPGSIRVDNELISSVRYAEHGGGFYSGYDHTVRVVLDLKDGITCKDNVTVEAMEGGVVLTTFLPDRAHDGFTPTTPLDPGRKTVVIDAGHGGSADGAKYEGVPEKTVNLSVARKLEAILKDRGYNVVMTRSNDSTVGLYRRADIANAVNADLFVSLHANASETNLQARGIYTYYHPTSKRGARLAQAIQSSVIQSTGAQDRGIKSADFVVLRETKMCAVLVEMGFMSTHGELMTLISDSYQNKLALGISEGIVRYLNQQA